MPGWYSVTAPPVIVRGIVVTGAQVKDNEADRRPLGRDPRLRRRHRPARLGLGHGRARPQRRPGRRPDLHPRHAEHVDRRRRRRRPRPRLPAARQRRRRLLGRATAPHAENDYNSSLVALDVTTGKPVWHFQTVHYDVWDYDLGRQVTLVDLPTDKGKVPAVILPSQAGPDLRPEPQDRRSRSSRSTSARCRRNGVEADALSPTQPHSGYARLDKPTLTERDMWGMSPLDQLFCRIQFRRAAYDGEYTAPTADRPYIEYPGYNGGSDWGSVAVDPTRGILVANYNDTAELQPADPAGRRPTPRASSRSTRAATRSRSARPAPQTGAPYAISVNAGWRVPCTGLLCTQPPYGYIRGIDLATGKTLWEHPFGSAETNGPFGIPSHAAADHRHPQQRRPARHRRRPDLHRRDHRPEAPRLRHRDRQGSSGRPTSPAAARPRR